jgi:hypothetical protein
MGHEQGLINEFIKFLNILGYSLFESKKLAVKRVLLVTLKIATNSCAQIRPRATLQDRLYRL